MSTDALPPRDDESLHDLVAAYAIDAVDDDERLRFEAHLTTCTSCAEELAALADVTVGLAEAVAVPPPSELRAAVLADIASTPQLPADSSHLDHSPGPEADDDDDDEDEIVVALARRRRRRWTVGIASAAAVSLLFAPLMILRDSQTSVDRVLAAEDAITTELASVDGTAELRVTASADLDRIAIIGSSLADPGPEQTYQLWLIAGSDIVSAGLFRPVDGQVAATVDSSVLADAAAAGAAWGVTIEPAAGSPAPTGEVLLFGEV